MSHREKDSTALGVIPGRRLNWLVAPRRPRIGVWVLARKVTSPGNSLTPSMVLNRGVRWADESETLSLRAQCYLVACVCRSPSAIGKPFQTGASRSDRDVWSPLMHSSVVSCLSIPFKHTPHSYGLAAYYLWEFTTAHPRSSPATALYTSHPMLEVLSPGPLGPPCTPRLHAGCMAGRSLHHMLRTCEC